MPLEEQLPIVISQQVKQSGINQSLDMQGEKLIEVS